MCDTCTDIACVSDLDIATGSVRTVATA